VPALRHLKGHSFLRRAAPRELRPKYLVFAGEQEEQTDGQA